MEILTGIRADASRVAGYIDQLDNFDAKDIALICMSENHMLYEEAYTIYVKFSRPEFTQDNEDQVEMQVLAIGVLVDFMKDLDRAKKSAIQCDESTVWSRLAKAQLEQGLTADTIENYIQAQDPSDYVLVFAAVYKSHVVAQLSPYKKRGKKRFAGRRSRFGAHSPFGESWIGNRGTQEEKSRYETANEGTQFGKHQPD